jgi:hypothetical protein
MSDDPETARQIAELARDERPLLVLDVDEVVLEFLRPFTSFLNARSLHLNCRSFRLHGNVVDPVTGAVVEDERVLLLMEEFFCVQGEWQTGAADAADVLARLSGGAEIVMLTAMPHRHKQGRRALLDRLGFPYPLVTTEAAKGPAVRRLRGDKPRPVAFVDDIPSNLMSVRKAVPDAALFHLMAHAGFRALLPPFVDDGVLMVDSWSEAESRIATALGI